MASLYHCHKNVPLHCPCRRTVNSELSWQVPVGLLVLSSIARKYINKLEEEEKETELEKQRNEEENNEKI